MIVILVLLSLLFLRQFAIYKQPSKINYAPLLIVIGVGGSLIHLMLHPHSEDVILLLRESAIPIFVSLLMYFILNILNQTQHSSAVLEEVVLRKQFLQDMRVVKDEVIYLNEKIATLNSSDDNSFESVRSVFKEDISALHVIQDNQKLFIHKFEDIMNRQQDGVKKFEEFSDIKMPEFDDIIHRHIEMLRIAEQDHFNKIKSALDSNENQKCNLNETLNGMHSSISSLQHSSSDVANKIVEKTSTNLKSTFNEYESYLHRLHSQSETLSTSINENESLLSNLKEQSEVLVQQMVLVSKKMDHIYSSTQQMSDINIHIDKLAQHVNRLEQESLSIKSEINEFSKQLVRTKDEDIERRNRELEKLSIALNSKIDMTLEKLYEQYHLAQNDISSTVQELASRSKIAKTYLIDEKE